MVISTKVLDLKKTLPKIPWIRPCQRPPIRGTRGVLRAKNPFLRKIPKLPP